jgi:hypothetical protein
MPISYRLVFTAQNMVFHDVSTVPAKTPPERHTHTHTHTHRADLYHLTRITDRNGNWSVTIPTLCKHRNSDLASVSGSQN